MLVRVCVDEKNEPKRSTQWEMARGNILLAACCFSVYLCTAFRDKPSVSVLDSQRCPRLGAAAGKSIWVTSKFAESNRATLQMHAKHCKRIIGRWCLLKAIPFHTLHPYFEHLQWLCRTCGSSLWTKPIEMIYSHALLVNIKDVWPCII